MKIFLHKREILVFIVLLILSIVFSSFYGGPVTFAWLYALLLILPLSALYIALNYFFLSVYQEIEVHKVSKGENHRYRAFIENTGILPIHKMKLLTLDDRCDMYEIPSGEKLSLGSRGKKELTSGISCRYAGAYNVGIEKVSFTDPFNLFSVELSVPYSFRAIVRPRITDIAEKALDIENLINNSGLKSVDQHEDIPGSDMRKYQRGDLLSSINWKVSARLGDTVVRIPDPMEKRTVTILMEVSDTPESLWDIEFLKRRDFFLEFVVSAAWHFGQQSVPVKIIYPAGEIKEQTVDSYDSFMEFYNVVSDGLSYSSEVVHNKLLSLAKEKRGSYGADTWILVREESRDQSDFCTVID